MKKYFDQGMARLLNHQKFKKQFLKTLPTGYHSAAKLLYYYKMNMTAEEKSLGKKIESFRNQIPNHYSETEVKTYISPHSNTFTISEESNHAEPGEFTSSNIHNVMKTGSGIFKGILLRRIIAETGKKRVLELGTNTGFASSYFASVDDVELVTIEGSEALCSIAEKNIGRISSNYTIMNCLFDDAIDQLKGKGEKFDCVFLDGQHEREATIHYTKRLAPIMADDAIFVFDDIYWSEDMNQAWKDLFVGFDFSYGVDLQLVGVCQRDRKAQKTSIYDINDCLPRPQIYRKGW